LRKQANKKKRQVNRIGNLEVIDEFGESQESGSSAPNYLKQLQKRKANFQKIMNEATEAGP
jgi:DUF971 family protein